MGKFVSIIGHVLVVVCTIGSAVQVIVSGPTVFSGVGWPLLFLVWWLLVNTAWAAKRRREEKESGPAVRKVTREEVDEASQNLSENLAGVGELRDRIDESAQGYRRKLESMGYSPTIAEQLAAQYHSQLIATLRGTTS